MVPPTDPQQPTVDAACAHIATRNRVSRSSLRRANGIRSMVTGDPPAPSAPIDERMSDGDGDLRDTPPREQTPSKARSPEPLPYIGDHRKGAITDLAGFFRSQESVVFFGDAIVDGRGRVRRDRIDISIFTDATKPNRAKVGPYGHAFKEYHGHYPDSYELARAAMHGDYEVFPDDGGPLKGMGRDLIVKGGLDLYNHPNFIVGRDYLRKFHGTSEFHRNEWRKTRLAEDYANRQHDKDAAARIGAAPPPRTKRARTPPTVVAPSAKRLRQSIGNADNRRAIESATAPMASLRITPQRAPRPTKVVRAPLFRFEELGNDYRD